MRKSRFTETQIIGSLKSVEAGRLVKDVCREHSVSEATYYQWKSKYGGMEALDIKRLKDLEDENRKLKMMVADLSLENHAFKEVLGLKRCPGPEAGLRQAIAGIWSESAPGVQSDGTRAQS
jgi:putative transposase